MKFEQINRRLYALAEIERTRENEFERDVLVGMQNILDCIHAFEVGNRKPTKVYDIAELIERTEYGLSLFKHAIGAFEEMEKASE